MRNVILVVHNVRSCHNVGSLLRTADGLGVTKVILSGYTPYPQAVDDSRMPHVAVKAHRQIHKTALGAEDTVSWAHGPDAPALIVRLQNRGYHVVALEQTPSATQLPDFVPPAKVALVAGNEVEGLEPELIARCDGAVEIPMHGQKESFNVAQAAAMALYHCAYFGR